MNRMINGKIKVATKMFKNILTFKEPIMIVMLLTLLILLTDSCTSSETSKNYKITDLNGVKRISNKNIPSVNNLEITYKDSIIIEGLSDDFTDSLQTFTSPTHIAKDSKNNIFVLDMNTSSIKKYDPSGKYIKSIGRKGSGPGEISSPRGMIIVNDKIYVADFVSHQVVIFDTEGKFIEKKHNKFGIPMMMESVGKDKIIGLFFNTEMKDDGFYMGMDLTLVDIEFKERKIISSYFQKYNPENFNTFDIFFAFTVDDKNERIFVAENSEDRYRISVLKFDGSLDFIIDKNYKKIEMTAKEIDIFQKWERKNQVPNSKYKYKKAVNFMEFDSQGRLWVLSSRERDENSFNDFIVDIFSSDGIFLKSVKLDNFPAFNTMIKLYPDVNKIYYIDKDNSRVKVYDF